MKLAVEEVVVVDVDMGVVEVDTVETPTMRIHSVILEDLLVKVPLKMEMLQSFLKGVDMVDLVVVIVAVVVVVVSPMEKLVLEIALTGNLNAVVGLDAGGYLYFFRLIFVSHVCLCI